MAIDDTTLNREARRILPRLCEPSAFLAIGQGMPYAVVMREADRLASARDLAAGVQPAPVRLASVRREVATAFVLRDWVSPFRPGRVTRYTITVRGRAALKRLSAAPPD